MKSIGLRIQLGHRPNVACINPKTAFNNEFVILDSHGVHEVGLDFCGCETAKHPYVQLLQRQLFPATTKQPRTAATFRVLRQFHLLSFESKCSGFEFYNSLAWETDNTGLQPVKVNAVDSVRTKLTVTVQDRYDEFMRMVRMWRNLKMLQRSGRGHDPKGIDATEPGQCAVLCPACPQPGKNLPDGWELAPQNEQYVNHRY